MGKPTTTINRLANLLCAYRADYTRHKLGIKACNECVEMATAMIINGVILIKQP